MARRLRDEPSMAGTVLVAVTGHGRVEDVKRSREAGFDHHLTKSGDFEALRRLLTSLEPAPKRE